MNTLIPWTIDWAATGQMLVGLGTLGLAGIAWLTFNQWAHRATFSADRDRAIKIMSIVAAADYKFKDIRSPMMSQGEIYSTMEKLKIADKTWEHLSQSERSLVQAQAVSDRINRHTEYFSNVFEMMALGEATFGPEVHDKLLEIVKARQAVYAAAVTYPHSTDEKYRRKYEAAFWEGAHVMAGLNEDPIKEQLTEAKNQLRTILSKYITPRRKN